MSEEAKTYEIAQRESGAVQTAVTPAQMLSIAVERGASIEQLSQLMDLQQRYEANEAKKAFHRAVAAFKADPPEVIKDMTNPQYKSRYSSLANLVNTVNAGLAPHGLHARWDYDQGEKTISATCILSHEMGHSERVTLAGPPDTSGSKNELQQIKSTTTYLRGATFEAVTGIASREGNADDDGNGAAAPPPVKKITEAQASRIADLLTATGTAEATLLKWVFAGPPPEDATISDIPATMGQRSIDRLTRRLEQQKKEAGK